MRRWGELAGVLSLLLSVNKALHCISLYCIFSFVNAKCVFLCTTQTEYSVSLQVHYERNLSVCFPYLQLRRL